MSIRVLVVDDQELVRAGFIMILDSQDDIEVVGETANGADALDEVKRLRPDVVLMDIRMPKMDGLEATRILRADKRSDVRVLILTTFDPDEYVYQALRVGASGFVLKDIPPHELLAAVRVVAKGEALLAPSITRRLIAQFAERLAPPASQELERLTDREAEVLRFMAKGFSNSEIADTLYLSPTTIKSHVAGVLAKLGLRDRTQAVVFAYENGVVRPGSTV
ncbi:MAG TPA: response regulator transcription factor [Acidimicrobiia bacterium]|nr:response regulator transcription factor [Acidimicrobiia bacterium]